MKIIDYTHENNNIEQYSLCLKHLYDIHNGRILYFDIETTGLSARNSTLYLIGALWFEDNMICIRQWFNEDGYTEKEIIESFNTFCSDFTYLVHFNGTTFDVPYIREKALKHNLTIDNIERLIQIDIFKEIRTYKKMFGLENMKQVTIEKFLKIYREDTYSGGELINVYQRYVARPDEEREHLLLLHNHNDLIGMINITAILNYKILFERPLIESHVIHFNDNNTQIEIDIIFPKHIIIPQRISFTNQYGTYINASDNQAIIIIPVIKDTLKHFFKDYKNYYYLPGEDMAIHKSVSSYVEPENRIKATKKNCYIKKTDSYVICFDKQYPELFMFNYCDKVTYRTCSSLINADDNTQIEYIRETLLSLI